MVSAMGLGLGVEELAIGGLSLGMESVRVRMELEWESAGLVPSVSATILSCGLLDKSANFPGHVSSSESWDYLP